MRRFINRLWTNVGHIAAKKWLIIALFGTVPLIVNPLFSLFMGIPHPQGTDEFGYLLMADTFAHGRIANPPHPLWENFQTFAELHHPTRTAFSPPMQGLFLAAGQLLFHLPIAGVWLSIGLMGAVMTWMLYGWLRPTWAFVGAFLAFINLGCYTYWSHTYWGGAPAAIGGALVFGALPRLIASRSALHAALLAIGCVILANSRPLEGFITCLPVAIIVVWLLVRTLILRRKFLGILLPPVLIFAVMIAGILASNRAITGNMFVMPQAQITKELSSVPFFLWQKPGPEPLFTSPIFKQCEYQFSRNYYQTKRSSFKGFYYWSTNNIANFINFYLGPALLVILIMCLPCFIKSRKAVFAIGTICLVAGFDAFGLSMLNQPNYIAPLSCLIFFLAANGIRHVNAFRIKRSRIGRIAVVLLLLVTLGSAGSNIVVNRMRPAFRPWQKEHAYSRGEERDRIINDLSSKRGRHCVVVRYGSNHFFADEWVYNRADIDGSRVIFARELDTERNRDLVRYFSDRTFWLLDVYDDNHKPRLTQWAGN
jgi:hypothetical protein